MKSLPAKEITQAELAKHNTEGDAWLAVDGVVYDVTSFVPSHPGGMAIARGLGTDATVGFHKITVLSIENPGALPANLHNAFVLQKHSQITLPDYLDKNVIGQLKK